MPLDPLEFSVELCDSAASDGPPPRTGHTATRLQHEIVFFGGMAAGECTSDAWALDVNSLMWQQLEPAGKAPDARLGHAACALEASGQIFVFGGGTGRVLLNDVWMLERGRSATTCSWHSQRCAGRPASRMGHVLAYLPAPHALVSFGGFVKGVKGGYSAQVLLLDLTTLTWTEPQLQPLPPANPPLRGRLGSAACVLDDGSTVLILGGSAFGELLDEALVLRTSTDASVSHAVSSTMRLERLPDCVSARAHTRVKPRPRAHGAALAVGPYVMHVGGCASDSEAAMDVLRCTSEVEPSDWDWCAAGAAVGGSSSALCATRHKHSLLLKHRYDGMSGQVEAILWGGDEKGRSSVDEVEESESKERCARLGVMRITIREDLPSKLVARSPAVSSPAAAIAAPLAVSAAQPVDSGEEGVHSVSGGSAPTRSPGERRQPPSPQFTLPAVCDDDVSAASRPSSIPPPATQLAVDDIKGLEAETALRAHERQGVVARRGRMSDEAPRALEMAEARLLAAETAEMRAAAEATRAAERVQRRRELMEKEKVLRKEAREAAALLQKSEGHQKEAQAQNAARQAAERVRARREHSKAAVRESHEKASAQAVQDSLTRATRERDRLLRASHASRRTKEEERTAWLSEAQAATRFHAEAARLETVLKEEARQREAMLEALEVVHNAEPQTTSAATPTSAEGGATVTGTAVQAAEEGYALIEHHLGDVRVKVAETRLVDARRAAEMELSKALLLVGGAASLEESVTCISRLREALALAEEAGMSSESLTIGREALARALEAVHAEAAMAAASAAAAATATAVHERAQANSMPDGAQLASLNHDTAPVPRPAHSERGFMPSSERIEARLPAISEARMDEGVILVAEEELRQAEAMESGGVAVQTSDRSNSGISTRNETDTAQCTLSTDACLQCATLPSTASRLLRARSERAAQAERRALVAKEEAEAFAKVDAAAHIHEQADAQQQVSGVGMRSVLQHLDGNRAIHCTGNGNGNSYTDVADQAGRDQVHTAGCAQVQAAGCAQGTVWGPRCFISGAGDGCPTVCHNVVMPSVVGSHTSQECDRLNSQLKQALLRADALDRDAAMLRDALVAKSAEIDGLRRETQRLRERAEAAESHLPRLSPESCSRDNRSTLMIRELQARLTQSDERSLRGEVLVAKLRSFIAAHCSWQEQAQDS